MNWQWASIIVSLVSLVGISVIVAIWKQVRMAEAAFTYQTEMEKPHPFFYTRRPQTPEEALQMLQKWQETGEVQQPPDGDS